MLPGAATIGASDDAAWPRGRRGSALVGLLWCLALLSIIVVGVLHASSTELKVTRNHGHAIQAHYLALAGVEKAKALLYHEARERKGSKVQHSGKLYDSPTEFRDVPLGRGVFRVLRRGGGPREVVYGISDEESRLNVNLAEQEVLVKLPEMTAEAAASILDYRDKDNTARQGGGEADAYASLKPPYVPRNGPLLTLRELLMVRGVSRQLVLGEDDNQNGMLDPAEDDGEGSWPEDNRDGFLDAGWSGWLTVDSEVRLVNAAGEAQLNIQQATEDDLASVPGLTTDLAKAIVAYRESERFESLADLLEVTPPDNSGRPQSPGSDGPPGSAGSGAAQQSARTSGNRRQGPQLISEALLKDIADYLTSQDGTLHAGAVNINTAGVEVLACLPGLDRELAQAVVSHRQSSGFFSSVAHLLDVPNLTRDVFKQVAPHVAVRSDTFRVLSEGEVHRARKRIEVTVRIGATYVDTLSYREDDL